MATRLASVHVLAPRVGVRPSEVSDAPALRLRVVDLRDVDREAVQS